MSDAVDVKPKTEGAEYINLRVMSQDSTEVHFKIKRTTQMHKLMSAYCNRQGLSSSAVRFMFDGQPVQKDSTPAMLDMDNNDVIDVMQEQTGGSL